MIAGTPVLTHNPVNIEKTLSTRTPLGKDIYFNISFGSIIFA